MLSDRELAERLRGLLKGRADIAFAYLFGSRARGEAAADSDLDVAVWMHENAGSDFSRLKLDLLDLIGAGLHLDWVDVVILNAAPGTVRYVVQKEGRLLLDADPKARIAFECRARKDYWDFEPLLRGYGSAMFRRLEEGTFGARSARQVP
ncbi:MAG: nucleotidyltransferase domain-containing protein [Elusimicrobia bacterium]|nr:nucleotidyltransferase domain-containing protein [Elusimicrobiota bacterium]